MKEDFCVTHKENVSKTTLLRQIGYAYQAKLTIDIYVSFAIILKSFPFWFWYLTEQTMMTTQANLWTAFSPSMKYRTPWTVDSCANKLSGDKQSIQCCPEKHVK